MIPLLFSVAIGADLLQLPAEVHTLENGLTVILSEDRNTDTVALHLHYDVGMRDEREGEYGCAHLFEHLMFEGSKNVPNNAFDEWLTAAGGDNNAFTSDDETAYHMTFPSGALELALMLESDRMGFLDAGLDQENLTNQQKVVLQERAEGFDEPGGRSWDALSLIGWPKDHPYQHMVIGTVADVEGFDLERVRDFWKRHYRPQNAVLALVGNFDRAAALKKVERWFSDVPDTGPAPERATAQNVTLQPSDHVIEDRVEERSLFLVWPTVPVGHPDAEALDLLGTVLSGGSGTRLPDALYYDHSIVSGLGAFQNSEEIGGQFIVYLDTSRFTLPALQKRVQKQLKRIHKKPFTEAELERAKRSEVASLLDSLEELEDRAEVYVDCMRLEGKPQCTGDQIARVEAVSLEDLNRVFSTYLRTPPTTLSVVPIGDTGAIVGATKLELP